MVSIFENNILKTFSSAFHHQDEPVDESDKGWKYKGVRISEDTSPTTKQAILDERKERHRYNSRAWHSSFAQKGVSRLSFLMFCACVGGGRGSI